MEITNLRKRSVTIFLIINLQFIVKGIWSLRNVRVTIPDAVEVGHNALLSCTYDLEREPLYTLKWYKGEHEFYRYTPKEMPTIKTFKVSGLPHMNVVKDESNSSQVVLKDVFRSLSGRYSCEVTTDAPSFHALTASDDLKVVKLPTDLPKIILPKTDLQKRRYKDGDELHLTCISKGSTPAANLTWTINSGPLDDYYVEQNQAINIDKNTGLETTIKELKFNVRESHFNSNNSFKIKCTASLYSIFLNVTEINVLLEKPSKYVYTPETRKYPYSVTTSNKISNSNVHPVEEDANPAEMQNNKCEKLTFQNQMIFLFILLQTVKITL